jgi:hypothetical protein
VKNDGPEEGLLQAFGAGMVWGISHKFQ